MFLHFLQLVPGTFSFVLDFSADTINQFAWGKYDLYKAAKW